ncbi:MAG: DUF3501 family protein [Actinomyces sp.]|nr:MAG: DUF3501 family protein [Actinomyces sp.]
MTKLTLDDIADARAYERERDDFRRHVIELKKRRRVAVGPLVSFVFENRDTIRFQIQEMARVERLFSDEAIQTELDIYNPLIPEPGELVATMFIEFTSDAEQREWKPRLIGILDEVWLELGERRVRAVLDEDHAEMLTREVPPSVNFLRWRLDDDDIAVLEAGPVALAITHPNYTHRAELAPETVAELLSDARHGG